eukprot:TRINITY_DN5517_c0_g1_i4.p1 TRINITY_DN5517_c0_g1~~TRINITY_DN5517_c0_g1_i4.p1  ORF type:complete len:191 (+),score=56.61 TRINITY_DN5517_c0_g1_i4:27-575(+)
MHTHTRTRTHPLQDRLHTPRNTLDFVFEPRASKTAKMDPALLLTFLFMVLEALVVGILCLPMPSNFVRRSVVDMLVKVWHGQQFVRFFAVLMLAINAFYFYKSYVYLQDHTGPAHGQNEVIKRIREQRNAYLTGAGLFLFVILYRLIEIHSQLHAARENQKRTQKGESVDTPKPSAPPMPAQ